jgi:hypothetical protein
MNTSQQTPTLLAVTPAEDTYQPKLPRLAKGQALAELHRLGQLPLAEQERECIREILIVGTTTRWSRPLNRDAVPFKNIRGTKSHRLLIWDDETSSLAAYQSVPENNEWLRILFTADPAAILAEMPKNMLSGSVPQRTATEAQIAALRKLLELPATVEMPTLHITAASRLMDRILIENTVATLSSDLTRIRGPRQEQHLVA